MRRGLLLPRPAGPIPVTSGLVARWDARDIVGVPDGGGVASWPDSSGNGWAAAQATGSKQPTWQRAGINGMPAVKFDGTDDLLVVANQVSAAVAGTILAVVQRRSTNQFTILTSSDEASTTRLFSYQLNFAGTPQIQQRDNDTQDLMVGSLVEPVDKPAIVAITGDAAAWTLRAHGLVDPSLTVNTGTNSGQWLGATSARDNVVLGALKRTTETGFANGLFAFVALYSSVLSPADMQRMERWLGLIWKIPMP